MKITFIFRTPNKEKSIERVFSPIIRQLENQGNTTKCSFAWRFRPWPLALVANIVRYAIKSLCGGVYHITGDVQYVACWMNPQKTILTIHDCVMLHSDNAPSWLRKMISKFWYEKPLKRLQYITCVSEKTRLDVISFFPWAEKKLIVVPNPVGEEFTYSPRPFNSALPVILHVGTRSNKNLERVIESLDGIRCKLNIIGKLSEEQEQLLLAHRIDFKNSFQISAQEMLNNYICADLISFPSLYEGFGMPIIEGQAVGRPVITSDREPMKSVAGNGAYYVDPESVISIRQGFETLLEDAECRDRVNQLGIQNAERFHVSQISSGYELIYKRIMNNE